MAGQLNNEPLCTPTLSHLGRGPKKLLSQVAVAQVGDADSFGIRSKWNSKTKLLTLSSAEIDLIEALFLEHRSRISIHGKNDRGHLKPPGQVRGLKRAKKSRHLDRHRLSRCLAGTTRRSFHEVQIDVSGIGGIECHTIHTLSGQLSVEIYFVIETYVVYFVMLSETRLSGRL